MKNLFCFLIFATASTNSFSFLPEPITNTAVILYYVLGTTGAIVAGFSLLEENKKIATLKDELINLKQENASYKKQSLEDNGKTEKIENDLLTAKEETNKLTQEKYAIADKLANADQNNQKPDTHITELKLQLTQINRKLKEKSDSILEIEDNLKIETEKYNQVIEDSKNLSTTLKEMKNNATKEQQKHETQRLLHDNELHKKNQYILNLETELSKLENIESRIFEANEKNFTQEEKIENLQSKLKSLTIRKNNLATRNNNLTTLNNTLTAINDSLTTINDSLEKKNTKVIEENKILQILDEKPEDEIAELKKENAVMKQFIDDVLQAKETFNTTIASIPSQNPAAHYYVL